jgi:tetratricopeptide (TPR) repeat protein
MLGLAAGLAPRGNSPVPPPARPLATFRLPALAAGAGAVAATTVLLAGPWMSELEIDRAAEQWRGSPEAAFTRLDRARRLNPASARPDLAAGTIALRLGRLDQAESAFGRARDREPDNAYALLELGLIAAERDDRARAIALLRRVTVLHPRDDIPAQTLREVRAGRYVTTARVNQLLLRRAQGG